MAIYALLCVCINNKYVPVLALSEIEAQSIKKVGRNTNLRKHRKILQTL